MLSSQSLVPAVAGTPRYENGGLVAGIVCRSFATLCHPSGFPKFTNEVQHFIEVLPWDSNTNRSPLKNGVKLPDYVPPDPRSGKSLQIWIARHRPLLES